MNEIFYGLIAFLLLFEIFKIGNSDLLYREKKILHDNMKGTMADYQVEKIVETKIMDIFKFKESEAVGVIMPINV